MVYILWYQNDTKTIKVLIKFGLFFSNCGVKMTPQKLSFWGKSTGAKPNISMVGQKTKPII
jgi:hypothetical protein